MQSGCVYFKKCEPQREKRRKLEQIKTSGVPTPNQVMFKRKKCPPS